MRRHCSENTDGRHRSTALLAALLALALPPAALAQPDQSAEAEAPRGTLVLGELQLRPHLEVRERFEARIDPYTAAGTGDDQFFVGSRARLGLDARYQSLRLMVQLGDHRAFGQFPVGVDGGATTGLHQGFLEVALGAGWLRLGRQEINLGHQRMIGALNWSTTGRSFDALRTHLELGPTTLDLIGGVVRWVRGVSELDESVDPPVERSTRSEGDFLAALYFTWASLDAFGLDAFVLYRHDGPTEGDVDRERDIAAPGIRLFGQPLPGLNYELEGVFQAGRAAGARHLALAAAAELSYVIPVSIRPGFALGFSYASGGSGDDPLREFDNFYPTNHLFYGSADLFSWRNLLQGYLKVSSAPTVLPLVVSIGGHVQALADPGERWANAGGGTVGLDPSNEERLLGYEVDLQVGYTPWSWLKISAGYALFIPTTGAVNLGHPDPTHWTYLMIGSVLP